MNLLVRRDQVYAKEHSVGMGWPAAQAERPPTGEAIARYSAAIVCGVKLTRSAFATPTPYSGSAFAQLAM
jgi:hypothetical protein